MGQRPADFDQYWQDTLDALAGYPACPEIDALPLRTTDFATLYGVRLTSLGPYRVFGYLSIPAGRGPFPAIYYAPKYQSVLEIIPQGTANLQRSRYITFALAGRGQRNADTPYAAMFPGLLTEGIDQAASYIFRGIVADSVRGLQFLLTRRGAGSHARGRGWQRHGAHHRRAAAGSHACRDRPAALPRHCRAGPQDPGVPAGRDQRLSARLSLTGRERAPDAGLLRPARPLRHASSATTLVMAGAPGAVPDAPSLGRVVAALRGQVTVHVSEQSSYKDGLYAERWMAEQLGITDLPGHPSGALAVAAGPRLVVHPAAIATAGGRPPRCARRRTRAERRWPGAPVG